ncbi:hypothetical protein B0T25DRAFT_465944 [Lasiosphaeria hispida]|uniref:Ankyrin repeat protein n=1 Tax=Lasiosphaeria hispida TaxID=260671 RepID=A0AAJ0M967_9PEZI|nr:hypothetical protein B0T25DRAFT_465944 [Lasiosphaeria hispida]
MSTLGVQATYDTWFGQSLFWPARAVKLANRCAPSLLEAAKAGDCQGMAKLLRRVDDDLNAITARDKNGRTPLSWAAANGRFAMAEYLLFGGLSDLLGDLYGQQVIRDYDG